MGWDVLASVFCDHATEVRRTNDPCELLGTAIAYGWYAHFCDQHNLLPFIERRVILASVHPARHLPSWLAAQTASLGFKSIPSCADWDESVLRSPWELARVTDRQRAHCLYHGACDPLNLCQVSCWLGAGRFGPSLVPWYSESHHHSCDPVAQREAHSQRRCQKMMPLSCGWGPSLQCRLSFGSNSFKRLKGGSKQTT